MKILLHSNAPWTPSGYGQQVGLLAPRLAERADLAISAINGLALGSIVHEGITIYGGNGTGGFGDDVIVGHALSHFGDPGAGLVLTLFDVQGFDPSVWGQLNVACWVPVDHDPVLPAARQFFAETGSVPIAMSEFGRRQLAEFSPLHVPHGIDTGVFMPQARDEARATLGLPADAFVVGVVGTNHTVPSRKCLPQSIEAFARFRARHEDAHLYLHTELASRWLGVDVPAILDMFQLSPAEVTFTDQYRYTQRSFDTAEMAQMYSAFDVLLNPSMGEGFGLTVLEAQACGVPAIVTDFTAMSEVCGAGWRVAYEHFWSTQGSFQAVPLVSEITSALGECHALDPDARAELSARAREHAEAYDIDRVIDEHWLPVLAELERRFPELD